MHVVATSPCIWIIDILSPMKKQDKKISFAQRPCEPLYNIIKLHIVLLLLLHAVFLFCNAMLLCFCCNFSNRIKPSRIKKRIIKIKVLLYGWNPTFQKPDYCIFWGMPPKKNCSEGDVGPFSIIPYPEWDKRNSKGHKKLFTYSLPSSGNRNKLHFSRGEF